MKPRDLIELLLLAAVWGGSFLFMRVLAPLAGPWATADLRMLFGALFLGAVFLFTGFRPGMKKHFGVYLLIGVVNSALPFALYSWAALYLPASVEVVLNALSPAFGAVAGALFLGEKLTGKRVVGLVAGVVGVVVVSGGIDLGTRPETWWALAACLGAPLCYAIAGVLVKKTAQGTAPQGLAFGSQLLASFALAPALALGHVEAMADPGVLGLMALFGVLCSGLAYLWYYGLMQRIGPTKTLTVTFLMPLFGILWGFLFLGEALTANLLGGAVLILGGTALVALKFGTKPSALASAPPPTK